MSNLVIVTAVDNHNYIGCDHGLPWHKPDDLKFFRRLTTGHTVVMGRKTFDTIGKPLPNRENIVLTRDRNIKIPGVKMVYDYKEILNYHRPVYIIGGREIYKLFKPYTEIYYITMVRRYVPVCKPTVRFPTEGRYGHIVDELLDKGYIETPINREAYGVKDDSLEINLYTGE